MKKFVIDTSALLAAVLPDEKPSLKVKKTFDEFEKGHIDLIAPKLLEIEFADALKSNFIRKRITKKDIKKLISMLENLNIKYFDVKVSEITKIAIEKDLSAYDSCYVYLAKENKIPLVSLDKKLQTAAK